MNTLTEHFPTAVRIDGDAVEINTDFRVALRIMGAFSDPELTEPEKIEVMVRLLYPSPPRNLSAAAKQGMKFLNLGEPAEMSSDPPVYSFEKDSRYIYTAFKSSYDIDLESIGYMHWWKFRALFSDLGDCFFSQLVGIRSRMRTGELLDSERKFIVKNKALVYLNEDKRGNAVLKDFIAGIGKRREE